MKNYFSVQNKIVVVTGAGSGNGLSISMGLIEAGAIVIRVDKNFPDGLNEKSCDILCDLSSRQEIDCLTEKIKSMFSRIDGLVNNAGVSLSAENPYSEYENYQSTMDVNLHAAFYLTSGMLSLMLENGGSVVNITSLGAHLGFPGNPSYQIAKAGLAQFTRALSRDWAHKGIRANNICPGYIKTNMTRKSFENSDLNSERVKRMLIKRWGEPDDLVAPTIFLLSEGSGYITGIDLVVDGGWMANGL
jgi:2-deoxy-D-gluconate 3-dehydrogenase